MESLLVDPSRVVLESLECLQARLVSEVVSSSSSDEPEDEDEDDADELLESLSSLSWDSGRGTWAADARSFGLFGVGAGDILLDCVEPDSEEAGSESEDVDGSGLIDGFVKTDFPAPVAGFALFVLEGWSSESESSDESSSFLLRLFDWQAGVIFLSLSA
jgi:hypothetical protein